MLIPFRLTTPDFLAAAGLGAMTLVQQVAQFDGLANIATIVATGVVTWLLGRASNRNLIAKTDRTKQETYQLMIANTEALIALKEREVAMYRTQLEQQAKEHRALTEELRGKISALQLQLTEMQATVDRYNEENKRLTALLTKRLRRLFLSSSDGELQLVLHTENSDELEDYERSYEAGPDRDETV